MFWTRMYRRCIDTMGQFYHVTCRNKACRYRAELREGPGMLLYRQIINKEHGIRSGEENAPEVIKELLSKGHHLNGVATYLCPICHEYQVGYYLYVFESTKATPYGTIREYAVHYIDGAPHCEKCGSELVFVLNPRSSKQPCPKCGTDNMNVSAFGYYD